MRSEPILLKRTNGKCMHIVATFAVCSDGDATVQAIIAQTNQADSWWQVNKETKIADQLGTIARGKQEKNHD